MGLARSTRALSLRLRASTCQQRAADRHGHRNPVRHAPCALSRCLGTVAPQQSATTAWVSGSGFLGGLDSTWKAATARRLSTLTVGLLILHDSHRQGCLMTERTPWHQGRPCCLAALNHGEGRMPNSRFVAEALWSAFQSMGSPFFVSGR